MMEVFYRIYPGSDDNRPFFDGDKLALVYAGLISFVESCHHAGVRPKMTFLLDGCEEQPWRAMIGHLLGLLSPACARVINLDGAGNKPSFQYQLDLALESEHNTIYFAEDDYLYRREALLEISALAKAPIFWTPYDHPDRYIRADNRDNNAPHVFAWPTWHWRTAESTCMTFGGPKQLFVETQDILREHGCTGRQMWYPIIDAGYELWSPIPSLATHLEAGYMAMCVDWQEVLRSALNTAFGYSPTMWVPLEELQKELALRLERWR